MDEQALRGLLDRMGPEDKILQLVQVTAHSFGGGGDLQTGPAAALGLKPDQGNRLLSLVGAEKTQALQKTVLEQSEIPMLFMADVINGYRTVFPIPLAQGCSFDPELVKRCAQATAREASWAGLHCVFSPMVDLCRDARWGRCMESTGEDVYLNCRMAKAMVEGYQGDDLSDPEAGSTPARSCRITRCGRSICPATPRASGAARRWSWRPSTAFTGFPAPEIPIC